jgi:fido (protein-threonine AMPylation protein)
MKHNGRTVGITSPKDRSGLRNRWMALNEDQLNATEAEFIFKAQKKYLHTHVSPPHKWFNLSFLFEVHKAMLFPVWDWAGKQRRSEKNIGIKAYLIQSQLIDLCRDVIYWNEKPVDLTFLEQACIIHFRLASIHPFEDGNGRFSRLIADRYLKAHGCPYPLWPDKLHDNCDARNKYINSLQEADAGDFEPLIAFTQAQGALDPSLSELLSSPTFLRRLTMAQTRAIAKALLRRGAHIVYRSKADPYTQVALQRGARQRVLDFSDESRVRSAPDEEIKFKTRSRSPL